jgi:O-antigen/teichoic acid export membrane protein
MSKARGLLKGRAFRVATALTIQVAGAGLAFLFSMVLAKLIGVAELGLYFLAVTVVDIGATVSRLGLETTGLRLASIARSKGDWGSVGALYRKCMGLTLLVGIAMAFPIWLVVSHSSLGGDRSSQLRADLPILVFAVAPAALLIVQAEFLKSIEASGIGTLSYALMPPLLLLTGTGSLWLAGNLTLHAIFVLYVVGLVGSLAVAVVIWSRRAPAVWRRRGNIKTGPLLQNSFPVFLVTMMTLVMGWTDILVLGAWSDPEQVGVYGIAMRIALLTTFVLSAVNIVVAPQFAALHAAGDSAGLKRLAQRSAFWTRAIAVPILLVLLTAPDLILQLFGPKFKEGAWALRILAVGQFVSLATGPVGIILLMTGNEKIMRNIIAVSAALNLAGNLVLVPPYGAIGAAASTAMALAFMKIVSWAVVRNKLNVNTLAIPPWKGSASSADVDCTRAG